MHSRFCIWELTFGNYEIRLKIRFDLELGILDSGKRPKMVKYEVKYYII